MITDTSVAELADAPPLIGADRGEVSASSLSVGSNPSARTTNDLHSHYDREHYVLYHADVWLPIRIRERVLTEFPGSDTRLRLGKHYFYSGRNTPDEIVMPERFWVFNVVLLRQSRAIHRAAIRFGVDARRDLCVVVEFPHEENDLPRLEVVTAYYNWRWDRHANLDTSVYEPWPESVAQDYGLTVK